MRLGTKWVLVPKAFCIPWINPTADKCVANPRERSGPTRAIGGRASAASDNACFVDDAPPSQRFVTPAPNGAGARVLRPELTAHSEHISE